jgi:hypothetical protein
MCDAIDAVSRRTVPEISTGASTGGAEDDATRKGLLIRRAACRISWLLVFVLRNASTSATPLELTHDAGRVAISRLVTEGDCLTPAQEPKFVRGTPDFFFFKQRALHFGLRKRAA